ncbi:iron-enterobactin transporter membrane protein [Escherichia coli]|uniref:Iron-enterobactin transporter membrane protein n=1 Tax=Escherichia coli TaxID=562 RepID=A0A376KYP0_ECOLX|nr:iron-enterobactin transporter membrane protein [Escherichia coli]
MSGSVAVTRAIAVPGLLLLLIIATALSLLIGAKSLPASVVLEALSGTCQSADCTIVLDARLPRTLAGLLAGGALGLGRGVDANPHPKSTCRPRLAWRECRSQLCHCAGCGAVWLLIRAGTTGDGLRRGAGGLIDCCLYRQSRAAGS